MSFFIQDGKNALHMASIAGHTKIISLLLDHGADIHEVDEGVGDIVESVDSLCMKNAYVHITLIHFKTLQS